MHPFSSRYLDHGLSLLPQAASIDIEVGCCLPNRGSLDDTAALGYLSIYIVDMDKQRYVRLSYFAVMVASSGLTCLSWLFGLLGLDDAVVERPPLAMDA